MTRQETFDKVVNAILKQSRPSKHKDGLCRYRHMLKDGTVLKCAAGHLIPDEKYDQNMEGCDVYSHRIQSVLHSEGHITSFVFELQQAHDHASDSEDFLPSFIKSVSGIAERYGLSTKALKV